MEFLAPFFAAAGIVAGTIPVVLHMLRRAPTERMPFSVVRFLKPSRPTMTKRSKIEHWPLMLLRILALVLIALAFARPFQRRAVVSDEVDGSVQYVALLIDRSASMRRDGIRDDVETIVTEVSNELSDGDLLSVSVFSRQSETLISAELWAQAAAGERRALIEEALQAYEPDWTGTQTGAALRLAADELAQENALRRDIRDRRIVLVTDFQEGSVLDQLKTSDWPASVQIDLRIVSPTQPGNAGVAWFPDTSSTDRIRVRVANAGDSTTSEYRLQTFDENGAAVGEVMSVTVQPGQRRTIMLPKVDEQTSRLIAGVELLDDAHPFDNIVDLPASEDAVVRVAHIGPPQRNDPENMRYYLQRALDGATGWKVELIDAIQPDQVALPVPEDVRLIIATDTVPEGMMPSVKSCLQRGGVLVAVVRSAEMGASLADLFPAQLQVQDAVVDDYAMLGQIDFEDRLFSAFSDAKFADFSSIRFFQYRRLMFAPEDERWDTVAKFDSGDPAIVRVDSGEGGSFLLLASGWHPQDSQWALSTRFPPMISRFVSMAIPEQSDYVLKSTGDSIRPALLVSSDDWSLDLPDGTSLTADEAEAMADATDSVSNQPAEPAVTLADPGRYTIRADTQDGPVEVAVIVAVPSSESRTDPLPSGQLQVMGVDPDNVKSDVAPEQTEDDNTTINQLSVSELESQQKLWRWFLLSGLACLGLESVVAAAVGRRQQESEA